MRPCTTKIHISAKMLSFSHLKNTTNSRIPITLPNSLPDFVSCPQLVFTRRTTVHGLGGFCSICQLTPPPPPYPTVVSIKRVNLGSPKISMQLPEIYAYSKVRCRMDVRKLSLAFGVTLVVYGMC